MMGKGYKKTDNELQAQNIKGEYINNLLESYQFWKCQFSKETASDDKPIITAIHIEYITMYELLYELGYRILNFQGQKNLIKIFDGKVIKFADGFDIQVEIFEAVELKYDWDYSTEKGRLKEKLIRAVSTWTNIQKLHYLQPKEPIIFNEDTINSKFTYFQNGFLEIDKKRIHFNTYDKLEGYIWEQDMLPRDYQKPNNKNLNYIEDFFKKIAGKKAMRYEHLQIIAGYFLHSFTDYALKTMLITDSNIGEDDEANGRSGKTLFCKILGYTITDNPSKSLRSTYVEINGKTFDHKAQFKYAGCGLDTKLVIINDLKKNFDLEVLYNDITEGIMVEKKGDNPYRIITKMILPTNKTVRIIGDSSKARVIEYQLTDYFNANHEPEKEYGIWFFREFKEIDWNNYDYYMAECCQKFFLNNGELPKVLQINLEARKLRENIPPEFLEYMELRNIKPNDEIEVSDFLKDFQLKYEDFAKLTNRKVWQWLKIFITYSDGYAKFDKSENVKRTRESKKFIFVSSKKDKMPF